MRVRARGVVQGVGFRPYVYRLAGELGLAGSVRNDAEGVLIEAEGDAAAVEAFLVRLPREAPPLALVEGVTSTTLPVTGERGFSVAASAPGEAPEPAIPADVATCSDCLAEVLDPADRRHRYPFVNCTNCGPRFTIIRRVPYDRWSTTMAGFRMCERCRAEYDDPGDRRFHAEPNACPDCGPELRLLGAHDGSPRGRGEEALGTAVAALAAGGILAVKGIGGYHLACRADDEDAVRLLRRRKRREQRPLALMARDLGSARELVELTAAEERLLEGRERPIVIARRRERAPVAPSVAPGRPDLGVMLAYSPLHHLLLADLGVPLVMTSANLAEEPIPHADEDAAVRLRDIADLILAHDRPIHVRADDSVVRSLSPSLRAEPLVIRRGRGLVPSALPLPVPARRPILACGAELKSTFCLARGERAWVSQHIGDLSGYANLTAFRDGVEHLRGLLEVEPELVARDRHPDYRSSTYAQGLGIDAIAVQHHHAHLAAVLAEHGEEGPAVGAIFDGAGLGPDGTVWGGELLVGDLRGFERGGLLFPVRLPGGDAAAREPWRMACAWLSAATGEGPELPAGLSEQVGEARWDAVARMIRSGLSSPLTTSAGRLFDAVAALCGLRSESGYEGQAAAELESVAAPEAAVRESAAYPMPLIAEGDAPVILDARETIRAIVADLSAGASADVVSARFHLGLARATAAGCAALAERHSVGTVVLAGGAFQNRILLERVARHLRDGGLRTLLPLRLPPNDGAISYGQAAVAAAGDAESGD